MTNLLPGNLSKDYRTKLAESGEASLDPGPDPGSANKDTTGDQAESPFPDNRDANKNTTKESPEGPTTENPTGGKGTQVQQEKETAPTTGYTEGPRPGYDDYGQELGKDARFWKAYVQESKVWDADMVDGWNNSLDLILIFAALFSAISTAFVIESSKALQPDPGETSAQTLTIISQTLLAMANTQPGSAFNFTPPEPTPFVAPTSAVWVNALWFLSLSLSVAVSLIAMLGKDWARGYMAELTGQPYQQARKRQRRWGALQEWRMPEVIMFLPSLLHLALLLFAVGLTIYLWNIHLGTAIPVLIVTLAATGAYVVSTVLPLANKHCPYYTPVSKLLTTLWPYISRSISPLIFACRRFASRIHGTSGPDLARSDPELAQPPQGATPPEEDSNLMDDLSSRALSWLIVNYGDTKSLDTALQAIAGADIHLPMKPLLECSVPDLIVHRLMNCCATRQKTGQRFLKDNKLLEAATLYSRAISVIARSDINNIPWDDRRQLAFGPMQCIIDYGLDSPSFSPNKVAFTLAGQVITKFLDDSAWVASAIHLLDSHFSDRITLEDPALLALLKAAAYVMEVTEVESLRPLVLALVQVLSALDGIPGSQIHDLIGVALTGFALVRGGYGTSHSIQSAPVGGGDIYRHYESHPPLTSADKESLILFGLLDLLKRDSAPVLQDSELVTITQALRRFLLRPEVLTFIYNFPDQTLDSYFTNTIKARITPESDGSFTNSETRRAAHLGVVNWYFLSILAPHERLHILSLALENLRSAKSSNLKQSCCDVLKDPDNFELLRSIARRDLSQLLESLLVRGVKSTDDRVLPYLAAAIFHISKLVLDSDIPPTGKHGILGPVLSHELFAKAGQTRSTPDTSPPPLFEMVKLWLLRLENMQGVVLLHIRESNFLHQLLRTFQDYSDHVRELHDRALALSRRCDALYESDGDQPLWSDPEDD